MRRKPIGTIYKVNISPARQINVVSRGRGRKLRLAQVKRFNELVKKGLLTVAFDSGKMKGVYVEKPIGREDRKLLMTISNLSLEAEFRASRKEVPERIKLTNKWSRFMSEHERKGQFVFLHPIIEATILKGKDPEALITQAEALNDQSFPGLRKTVEKFNTPKKIEANIRWQLRYFEQLLKKNHKTEMLIFREGSPVDETSTAVKLTKEGVLRETIGTQKLLPGSEILRVILHHNGKISFQQISSDV